MIRDVLAALLRKLLEDGPYLACLLLVTCTVQGVVLGLASNEASQAVAESAKRMYVVADKTEQAMRTIAEQVQRMDGELTAQNATFGDLAQRVDAGRRELGVLSEQWRKLAWQHQPEFAFREQVMERLQNLEAHKP